ncbi:MAG TPA: PfkB family carbohydrate kinase [Anaerolineaceae bacterium]|nr:PfkB family carbohydrate kinase [Anaerolineaceae bacterium]
MAVDTYDVVVVGDYCLDLIFTGLPKMPELGVEIVSKGFEMIPGGPYNTAVAMHRLGIRVGWACDFGSDEFSRYVLAETKKEGLDDRLFRQNACPLRNITVSLSYPTDRAFIAFYDLSPAIPAVIKALPGISTRYLYIPGIYTGPALDAGSLLLKAKRIKVIMDGNSVENASLDNPEVRKAIQLSDIFLPNAREVRRLTGKQDLLEGIRALADLVPLLVVKDGRNGAYALKKGETLVYIPALEISPVDTTGAGDCFNAGFLKAWLTGKSLEECLKWGNIVGGLSTLELGGTGKRITEQDVYERLSQMVGKQ